MEIKDGPMTTTVPDRTPTFTHAEWLAEGRRRFGDNFEKWRFVCPICGNVAAVSEYRQFKDCGATPDSAAKECIGRYLPKDQTHKAFGANTKERGKPCDYAIYGLFRIPGAIVTGDDGHKMLAFAFAEEINAE